MPQQIPEHLDNVGRGWHPLLLRLHEQLLAVSPEYGVGQVKEKYGTLRVYLRTSLLRGPYLESGLSPDRQRTEGTARDAAVRRLVAAAEEESARTCESCGSPGRARDRAWIKTLCDYCNDPHPGPCIGRADR